MRLRTVIERTPTALTIARSLLRSTGPPAARGATRCWTPAKPVGGDAVTAFLCFDATLNEAALLFLFACAPAHQASPTPPEVPAPLEIPAPVTVAQAFVHALQALDGDAAAALVDAPSAWWIDLAFAMPGRDTPNLPGVDTRRMSFDERTLWVFDHPGDYAHETVQKFLRANPGLPVGETLSTVACTVGPGLRTRPVTVPAAPLATSDPMEGRMSAWARSIDSVAEVAMACDHAVWMGGGEVMWPLEVFGVVLVHRAGEWRVVSLDVQGKGWLYDEASRVFDAFSPPVR